MNCKWGKVGRSICKNRLSHFIKSERKTILANTTEANIYILVDYSVVVFPSYVTSHA